MKWELGLPFKHFPPHQEKSLKEEKIVAPQKAMGEEAASPLWRKGLLEYLEYWDALGKESYRDASRQALCFLLQRSYCFQSHILPSSPAFALSTKTAVHRE